MNNNSLKRKTVKGLAWSITELVSKQGIQLIIQVILARLLVPEHFGLIGMITIFIAISNTLVNSGMDQALIRESSPTKADLSTVFYFNLFVSLLIYIILFLIAPYVSLFFNEPQLVNIIRVLMLIVIINALGTIQKVILIRNVDFKTQTKITMIAGVLSGFLAILFAVNGLGVWSLVIQIMTMQLTQTILFYLNNRWLPSLTFNIDTFKAYFSFGYKLLISSLIDTTYKNIYFVIIGVLYSTNYLGYYTNASKLRDISSQSITQAIQKVTYPVLSSIKEENTRLSNGYKQVIKMSGYVIFPIMMGLAATAPNFIPLLLGEQWVPSVKYFQLLCFAGMLYPIHSINLNILKVKGRSDLFLKLEIIKKVILTMLIICAVSLNTGIIGLISAALLNSYIALFINMYYSGKEVSYKFLDQIKDLAPIFTISLLMSFLVYLLKNWIGIYFVDLILQIVFGIFLYVVLSLIFRVTEFKELAIILKNFIK
ncbi:MULTISPECIES: lipopolysaccharide biosynthesis protein [Allobacillus]|nr:lipopolysaccharide biosynthesis protein [Allobacillus salarius]